MNPFLSYVEQIEAGFQMAKNIRVSGTAASRQSDSKMLLFSPHPDDECITGLLPLRLMRELGKQVINIPVTFGSKVERRAGRAAELADACAYLGWENHAAKDDLTELSAGDISGLLKQFSPEMVFMPHAGDWNSRHVSTHFLVMEALESMPIDFSCTVVETEFWGAMDDPNLMVEGDAGMVADLVAATSLHVGEVRRNPYHLLLPAWMQDNVRRGGELVGGQGREAPAFSFATLYRLRKWKNGRLVDCLKTGTMVPMGAESLMEVI